MGIKIIAKNKRAFYDYLIHEKVEAGLVLQGTEVKSLRKGKVTISDAYVAVDKNEEAWIYNMLIPHYEFGNVNNHKENRKRKLLLQKEQIQKIQLRMKQKNFAIIPLKIYFNKSYVKIEIGLATGKKQYDKRQDMKTKSVEKNLRQGKYDS